MILIIFEYILSTAAKKKLQQARDTLSQISFLHINWPLFMIVEVIERAHTAHAVIKCYYDVGSR